MCREEPLNLVEPVQAGEVHGNPPVADLVGMGQRVMRDGAPQTHLVELGLGRAGAGLNIPQALPEGQLGKGQTGELILTGEARGLVVAIAPIDTLADLAVMGNEVHQLSEDRSAYLHGLAPLMKMREYGPRRVCRGNASALPTFVLLYG